MLRDQRGVATLEFVVIAMVLFAIMFAAFDFANLAQRQIALQGALRSGGEFARYFPTSPGANGGGSPPCTETAGTPRTVRCAVLNALPSGFTLTGLTMSCTCAGVAVACTAPGTCTPPFLMKLQASLPSVSIMTPLWTGGAVTQSGSYEVRIQ